MDPDQIRLAEAQSQELNNVRFFTIDSTQLPFEDGQFDIVFTNKVTHHIPDWEDTVAEMIRVLKPNGYLIYADLIYPDWLAAIGKSVAGNRAGFPTSGTLSSIFGQYGLSKIHLSRSSMYYEAALQKQKV